jgi:hypothetical protein
MSVEIVISARCWIIVVATATLTIWYLPGPAELNVELTLWQFLATVIGALVTFLVEVVFHRVSPENPLRDGLTVRLQCAEDVLASHRVSGRAGVQADHTICCDRHQHSPSATLSEILGVKTMRDSSIEPLKKQMHEAELEVDANECKIQFTDLKYTYPDEYNTVRTEQEQHRQHALKAKASIVLQVEAMKVQNQKMRFMTTVSILNWLRGPRVTRSCHFQNYLGSAHIW